MAIQHDVARGPPRSTTGPGTAALARTLLCCLAAFLAGRISVRTTTDPLPPSGLEVLPPDALAQACLQASGLVQQRPPLQPGASGNTDYTLAPYQVLSMQPRIVLFPNFIDAQRAQHIIQMARDQLRPSTIRAKGGGEAQTEHTQGRTSSGTFLSKDDDAAGTLAWLEQRIQDVTLIPTSHGEKFYVIRYQAGEEYQVHLDAHDEAEYGQARSMRLATVVVYLCDVAAGGATIFPREGADGAARPVGPASCSGSSSQGLRYQPRQGDALLFYSLDVAGESIDPHAAHGGCPVRSGNEKWVITKWLHNKPVRHEASGFGWG